MKKVLKEIKLKTDDEIQLLDFTAELKAIVTGSGIRDGAVTIMTQHTTSAININEKEEGLAEDMVMFLSHMVPKQAGYVHNRNASDGRPNAHSHLMSLFTNASETIPVSDGKMLLGDWQSVFFVEMDGPRPERSVIVHITGE